MDVHEKQVGLRMVPKIFHALGHAFEHPRHLHVRRRLAQNGPQVDRRRGLVFDNQRTEHVSGF